MAAGNGYNCCTGVLPCRPSCRRRKNIGRVVQCWDDCGCWVFLGFEEARLVLDYGNFHCVSSRSFRGVASPAGQAMEYVHWNYVQMLPFGLLDFAIAYGIIRLVENVAKRSS